MTPTATLPLVSGDFVSDAITRMKSAADAALSKVQAVLATDPTSVGKVVAHYRSILADTGPRIVAAHRRVAEARAKYPHLAERFVFGNLFDPPNEMRGAFDVVLEHTCMSALSPTLRADYRRGIDLTLRPGGLLIGVWFINPALDPGELGPPFPFSVADLTALFAKDYEVVEDYVPDVAFPGREGRERVRVLRRVV